MLSERAEYYRNLLTSRSWYAEGLSWTVIQPAGSSVTVKEVIRRLHAEPIDLDEIQFPHVNDLRPDDPSPLLVAGLRQVGSDVVMFQHFGGEGARPEVLRWLSDRARVHNVDWTINGNGGISYGIYGTLLAWVDKNDPDRRGGTHPDVLDDDLADLVEAKRLRDVDDWPASRLVTEAAAMATVERRTGVRLPEAWVDNPAVPPWTSVMLGRIPSDPRPPGRFGIHDPDLDARLRGGPASVRHAALLLAVRTMAERFTWSDPEAVAATVAAIERGEPLDQETRGRVFHCRATRDNGEHNGSASHGLYMATSPPAQGDPLDAIEAVTYALPDEWPVLRREIGALLRRPTDGGGA